MKCPIHHWWEEDEDADNSKSMAAALTWWLFCQGQMLVRIRRASASCVGSHRQSNIHFFPFRNVTEWNCASSLRPGQSFDLLALPLRALCPFQDCSCPWGFQLHPRPAVHRDPRAGCRGVKVVCQGGQSRAKQSRAEPCSLSCNMF